MDDLTFVNKTSTNFRTRSRREASQINSHINGRYARWKRKENTKRLRTELVTLPPDGEGPIEDNRRTAVSIQAPFVLEPRSPPRAYRSQRIFSQRPSPPGARTSLISGELSSLDASESSQAATSTRASSRSPEHNDHLQISCNDSVLCRGNSDPFDSTVVPLTALNSHCIRLARSFQVDSIWAEEMGRDDLKAATINWWLADGIAVRFETAMHGLLAWAYSVSALLLPGDPVDPGERDR